MYPVGYPDMTKMEENKMSNLLINAEMMKGQSVGVEIEMAKIAKTKACDLVYGYYKNKYPDSTQCVPQWYEGGPHDAYACADNQGRVWKFMDDGSSSGDWGHISCEMVTPILYYDDMEDLQAIVRLMRENGAKSGAHYNAGVHIHVGANFDEEGGQNAKTIRHLVNIIASHEDLIARSINASPSRYNWFKFVDRSFLELVNRRKPKTKVELEKCWYGFTGRHPHYDDTRYHMLNLHAIWDKGTIEFRCFEFHNNLHAGELKAWIQLCMAMCSYAKIVSRSSFKPVDQTNQKWAMANFLKNLGLIGGEFKTARKMLTKNLTGDCAYKHGRVSNDLDDADFDTCINDGYLTNNH